MSEGQVAPPGVDPETGEVLDAEALRKSVTDAPAAPALPGQTGLAKMRQQPKQPLETGQQVYAAMLLELRKMELASERLAEVRKERHGYYVPDPDDPDNMMFVAGAEFEYAEEFDREVTALYERCHDTSVKKEDRPKWPGADVRESIVNQAVDEAFRQRRMSLKGEQETLERYLKVCETRLSALQSLLGWHREEMRNSGITQQ